MYRQWVLSFPHALRYRLAYDAQLVSAVLNIFIKTIFASLIRRAREFGVTRKAQCGAVDVYTEVRLGARSQPPYARPRDRRRIC